jgi:hypothetical protein
MEILFGKGSAKQLSEAIKNKNITIKILSDKCLNGGNRQNPCLYIKVGSLERCFDIEWLFQIRIDDTRWFLEEAKRNLSTLRSLPWWSRLIYFGTHIKQGGEWDYKSNRYYLMTEITRELDKSYGKHFTPLIINERNVDTAGPANYEYGAGMKALGGEWGAVPISDILELPKVLSGEDSISTVVNNLTTPGNYGHIDYPDDIQQVQEGMSGTIFIQKVDPVPIYQSQATA